MNPEDSTENKPSLPPEELARRKRQIWLVVGVMLLAFCLTVVLLLVVFIKFGPDIRRLITGWVGG